MTKKPLAIVTGVVTFMAASAELRVAAQAVHTYEATVDLDGRTHIGSATIAVAPSLLEGTLLLTSPLEIRADILWPRLDSTFSFDHPYETGSGCRGAMKGTGTVSDAQDIDGILEVSGPCVPRPLSGTFRLRRAAERGAPTDRLRWEPYALGIPKGTRPAELARLRVPQRHALGSAGKTIEIAMVRLRSRAARAEAPLVYLDGGPGGSGYSVMRIPGYPALFDRILATRDVILLSQRGTGLSTPRLICPADEPLPNDFFVSEARMAALLAPRARRCAEAWRSKGIDPAAFNTEESADDVALVRRALGVPKLALFGFSYGTHLGLAILRRHPQSVDRAVLAGVEGPAHTWKYPSALDEQFERLASASRTVTPGLTAELRSLLDRAGREPLIVRTEGRGRARLLRLGAAGLRYVIRRDLGDTNDWPWLPAAIVQAARGDTSLLAGVTERRLQQLESGIALMPLAMDCASAASADRLARIAAEEPTSLRGSMSNFPFPAVCGVIGVGPLPHAYRTPVASDVPTLFVSGTLDGNSPAHQATEVAAAFSRGIELLVENAGHESSLPDPGVQREIVAFLETGRVSTTKLAVPMPKFRGVTR